MLSLLGDAEAADSGGPVAKLASLPYRLSVQIDEVPVGREGVARMSAGHLHHLNGATAEETPSLHEQPPTTPSPSTGEGRLHAPSTVPSPSTGEGEGGGESLPPRGEEGTETAQHAGREPKYVP
jgi:hypothetical protein